MTGERLGVGNEQRQGTGYVSSWIKVLENDLRETRAAAVDAQRISDWLIACKRERSLAERAGRERAAGGRHRGAAQSCQREPCGRWGDVSQPEQGVAGGRTRSATGRRLDVLPVGRIGDASGADPLGGTRCAQLRRRLAHPPAAGVCAGGLRTLAAEQAGPRGRTVLLRNMVDGEAFATAHWSQTV